MQLEYWQERWQLNEIGFNQVQPNQLLQRYFKTLNLKAGARVFVPLCGKSIDMLWLVQQGYEVVGVELSAVACEAFFTENAIPVNRRKVGDFTVFQSEKITLYAGDFFQCTSDILGDVDAVYDRAALIALPSELRRRYLVDLVRLISSDTPIFLITTSYNQEEMAGPPFSVTETMVTDLYGTHFDIKQLYNKSIQLIPPHLRAKGLMQANEQVYFLSQLNNT